jgi:hypothetical protein
LRKFSLGDGSATPHGFAAPHAFAALDAFAALYFITNW